MDQRGARKGRRIFGALFSLLLTASAVVLVPSSANAYNLLGCKLGTTTYVAYSSSVTSTWLTASQSARTRWNTDQSYVNLALNPPAASGPAKIVFSVNNTLDYDTYAGTTICANRTNNTAVIYWNTAGVASTYGATPKRMIAAHEIGHALGLNHTPIPGSSTATCTTAIAVMRQGPTKWQCNWGLEPFADDISGIAAIY